MREAVENQRGLGHPSILSNRGLDQPESPDEEFRPAFYIRSVAGGDDILHHQVKGQRS